MRLTLPRRQMHFMLFATLVATTQAGSALAQVEAIDPNPTLPFDMSRELEGHHGSSRGSARFGRTSSQPGLPREANPAETLLRDIEGSNYGRHTGHAILPQQPSRDVPRVAGRSPRSTYQPSPSPGRDGAAAISAPRGGRPENRWRYRFFRGFWWYWTDDSQWSYFNGRRWTTYPSTSAYRPDEASR